ncbi:MAG TPA: hypothetical protein VF411_00170 [Bacteroidia bacterium]
MASKKDYMTGTNQGFFNWDHNFIKVILMNYPGMTEANANAMIAGTMALPTAAHPWGMSQADMQVLLSGIQVYEVAYWKASNKKNRLPADTEDAKLKKKAQRLADRAFVNRFLRYNPLVTPALKTSLGLTVPTGKKTVHKTKIKLIPVTNAKPTGGCAATFTCRTATDQSKPSMPDLPTDRIEVRAKLVEHPRVQQQIINATAKQAPNTGTTPVTPTPAPVIVIPQTADDCDIYFDSSKAIFDHNFGLSDKDGHDNKGKQVYCFLRYGSSKNPLLAGDYSEVEIFTLL